MDDSIRAMREGMMEREARSSQLNWYLLLGTVVLAGAVLGLAWAFLAEPPARHPVETVAVQPAAPRVAEVQAPAGVPAVEMSSEIERALKVDAHYKQQRGAYGKTVRQLTSCARHDGGYRMLQINYSERNRPVLDRLEAAYNDVAPALVKHRQAEARAKGNRILVESLTGRNDTITAMFEDIETEMSKFDQMDSNAPLNPTECAEFRTFVQSGLRDLKPL